MACATYWPPLGSHTIARGMDRVLPPTGTQDGGDRETPPTNCPTREPISRPVLPSKRLKPPELFLRRRSPLGLSLPGEGHSRTRGTYRTARLTTCMLRPGDEGRARHYGLHLYTPHQVTILVGVGGYSCFTMLCQPLLHSEANQLFRDTHCFPPDRAAAFRPALCFALGNVYTSALLSPFIPAHPFLPLARPQAHSVHPSCPAHRFICTVCLDYTFVH